MNDHCRYWSRLTRDSGHDVCDRGNGVLDWRGCSCPCHCISQRGRAVYDARGKVVRFR